jgi:hypothetical protein
MVLLDSLDLKKYKKSFGLFFECKMAEKFKMAAKAYNALDMAKLLQKISTFGIC